MVYESDFYAPRRSYTSAPLRSTSYNYTTPSRYVSRVPASPNHRVQEYSSYTSTSTSSSSDGRNRPVTESRTTERKYESGPGGMNYTTERSSTTGNGPSGYSYSSSTSGRLPGGTYRHYSYRV